MYLCPSKGGQFLSRAEHSGGRAPTAQLLTNKHGSMVSMYNYIPHPSNCRQSSGIIALRIEEGAAGYGVYWMVLELLRDAPSYKYSCNPKAIAFAINESDIGLVERVCSNYGLFDSTDDGLIYSPWLLDQMGEYDEKKKKLREAGKKGAAHRWKGPSMEDGKPIASPSMEDGKAIAHDITYYNVIQDDFTLPDTSEGAVVGTDYCEMLSKTQPEGHAPAYVAQVCMHYGMKEATCDFICERTDNANLTNASYIKFCAIVKRIQAEKWVPKHPDQFFIKKVFGEI